MHDRLSTLFADLSRIVLITTLIAAPWPFGTYPVDWQPLIFGGVLAALLCWWISVLVRPSSHQEGHTILVDAFLPPLLFVLLAAVQLIPMPNTTEIPDRAVLHEVASLPGDAPKAPTLSTISAYPAATRLEAARILLVLCAAFLGIQLFASADRRLWLYVPLAINAAALAGFGIWQKLNWAELDGMLFGRVPLRFGGQPFASFVNRNNAAGYLNMGFCAAAAWGMLASAPRSSTRILRVSDSQPSLRTPEKHSALFPVTLALPILFTVLILSGVVASASRGGIAALAGGTLAALWFLISSRRFKTMLVGLLVVVPIAAAALVLTGIGDQALERISALDIGIADRESRFAHWKDTWNAVRDAPWIGGGLGAYAYINRPYQTDVHAGWYFNADNQYFEWLVETGLIGLALIAAFLLIAWIDIRRLTRSRSPWEQRDAALMGATLVATQGIQAFTDFGIIVPSNLLTAATLAGVLFGTAARSLPFDVAGGPAMPFIFRNRAGVLLGLVFAVAGGMAWWEVRLASIAFAARNSLPFLDRAERLSPPECDEAIARVTTATEARPDDAELQRVLGNLWIYRYRLGAVDLLRSEPAFASQTTEAIWPRTPIERLLSGLENLAASGFRSQRAETLKTADPNGALPSALDAFQRSIASCRWQPDTSERVAVLQMIVHENFSAAREAIADQAVAAPSDASQLLTLAALSLSAGADELCSICVRRSLILEPSLLSDALRTIEAGNRNASWVVRSLPPDVNLQLEAAEQFPGTPIALALADDAEKQLESKLAPRIGEFGQRGRILAIRGQNEEALKLFEKAISETPGDWQWYYRAAMIGLKNGDVASAMMHVRNAQQRAPTQSAIQKKLADLKKQAEVGLMSAGQQ